jgi:hypothetical protein
MGVIRQQAQRLQTAVAARADHSDAFVCSHAKDLKTRIVVATAQPPSPGQGAGRGPTNV